MALRWKIFLGFSLLIMATLMWGLNLSHEQLRPRYLEAIEDTLFDVSSYFSQVIETEGLNKKGQIESETIKRLLSKPVSVPIPAKIYSKIKDRVELRIYVTDARGTVIFDTDSPGDVGRSYWHWNDVHRTLLGRYGARSTRVDAEDAMSSTLYVATPIKFHDRIIGVVSVGKPLDSLRTFFSQAEYKFFQGLALLVVLSLAITYFISQATLSSLNKLSRYVRSLGSKSPKPFPNLGSPEIRELGASFQEMKNRLDGREYVERYVTSLTHEIKSPLSGILGATELVTSKEISEVDRDRLLKNIHDEAHRLRDVSERILELASLEKRSRPLKMELFDISAVIEEIEESLTTQTRARKARLETVLPDGECLFKGERFLIWRALYNLVQNAIEFSPNEGLVKVSVKAEDAAIRVEVIDEGPGLPDFVVQRLFEKFFSTERPSTGKRGIGLGLSFVREVVEQHNGNISLKNRTDRSGTAVTVLMPNKRN